MDNTVTQLIDPLGAEKYNLEQIKQFEEAGWTFHGTFIVGSQGIPIGDIETAALGILWTVQPHFTGEVWNNHDGFISRGVSPNAFNVYRKAIKELEK